MFLSHSAGNSLKYVILSLSLLLVLLFGAIAHAEGTDTSEGAETPLPDLFTGTLNYRIPIDVPPGRKGMTPSVVLSYRSTNGNGWIGVGWDLELGAIERNTKGGINYSGNEYVLREAEGGTELVYAGVGEEYRAKIEGRFSRIVRISNDISAAGPYWEAIDKKGTRYRFGFHKGSSRQYVNEPNVMDMDFRWYLDRIVDANDNYIDFDYVKYGNQIYLEKIHYTGNTTTGLLPTNTVIFILEDQDRYDALTSYTTLYPRAQNAALYAVTIKKRLKAIVVKANNDTEFVKKYELGYTDATAPGSQYSPLTGMSLLRSITEYGSDGTAHKPPITFTYNEPQAWTIPTPAVNLSLLSSAKKANAYCLSGQFAATNDVVCSTSGNDDGWDLKSVVYKNTLTNWTAARPSSPVILGEQCFSGDFKGDGKTVIACNTDPKGASNTWVMASIGETSVDTWKNESWANGPTPGVSRQCFPGDYNGDGKTDLACFIPDGYQTAWQLALSTGSGWSTSKQPWTDYGTPLSNCLTGDFTGDGKTEIACNQSGTSKWDVYRNDPYRGWVGAPWDGGATMTIPPLNQKPDYYPIGAYCRAGDFNGDAKTDIACYIESKWKVLLSTGNSWDTTSFTAGGPAPTVPVYDHCLTGNFNGDDKTDIACYVSSKWEIGASTGNGWMTLPWDGSGPASGSVGQQCFPVDYTGDGKTDILCLDGANWLNSHAGSEPTDLLTRINNGIGGATSFKYKPSTDLPFVKLLLAEVSVNDGNGTNSPVASTNYVYAGGYYHSGAKEFRGFNHVTVTGPAGADGEQTVTDTWFHQGNNTAVGADDPKAAIGFMKGKPYLTRVSDSQGNIYSEIETTYTTYRSGPYNFSPATRVESFNCDGQARGLCKGDRSARYTRTDFFYDDYLTPEHNDYGNITREDHYGDVENPGNVLLNKTIVREFAENTDDATRSWLVGFPASETVYQGIGSSDVNLIRKTDFYYDSYKKMPEKGNLVRVERWLKGETALKSKTMAYDSYGNQTRYCDENKPNCGIGEYSETVYDNQTDQTFPVSVISPLVKVGGEKLTSSYTYYGVNATGTKGRFGQQASVTDANGQATTTEYDIFGRKKRETRPDGYWTDNDYNSFGTVGFQHIYTYDQLGMGSRSYFDGLGRTIMVRKSGPDNKVIVTTTEYDARGKVKKVSLPYFEDDRAAAVYRSYHYDPIGRVTQVDNPDNTNVRYCYNGLSTVIIDENNHGRRETRDILGRLAKVEEYTGDMPACGASLGAPYATTDYGYDVLGNLTSVTVDASKPGEPTNKKVTSIEYDTLGRKKKMTDPDMGIWEYDYYGDGTLKAMIDANHKTNRQAITFDIDYLNRVTAKHYPADSAMTSVTYGYDGEGTDSANPKGRLTSMTDASGKTVYHYDVVGRGTKTVRTVGGHDYRIVKDYEGAGRLHNILYPDDELVHYEYDNAGNLWKAGSYAEFKDYNALGQPMKINYGNGAATGNGVVTDYTYHPGNYRLATLKTRNGQAILIDREYLYDLKGNVTEIADKVSDVNPLITDSVSYTLDPARAHAVLSTSTGRMYKYDANGNMETDGFRTLTYTPDNMPISVTSYGSTISFVYDGNGKRVKKTVGASSRIYIDNLHECATSDGCGNYIFANNTRIAFHTGVKTYFYHPDHLGSTSIVTDAAGNQVESVHYDPFGETVQDNGTEKVLHKFTGQEQDYEVGLYNYGARLYDPEIGRFITPDSIVPDYTNPQSLNRYAYVRNNPMKFVDPTGHFEWQFSFSSILDFFTGESSVSYRSGNPPPNPEASFSSGSNNRQTQITYGNFPTQNNTDTASNDYGAKGQMSFEEPPLVCWEQNVGGNAGTNAEGTNSNDGAWTFSVGVSGTLGGQIFPTFPGLYGGGGVNVGVIPSTGQAFMQFQANGMTGAGYFAGIGVSGMVGRTTGNMPIYSVDRALHVEGNAGWGPSAGYSVDRNSGSISAGKGLRGGVGYGVMLGGGISQALTIATPSLW
ncbi:hypothetical protein KI809_11295 [Geobacter pelophilus]|uniref:PI-PLC Y-box domain-containing protein n=1 Tax=Geoanaerobacter pelophilus TaxID=60036 RepID=A0AAW4LCI3_9BACT|nr:RHS repeat-associated core domain-containing protein [Geoanaerobacter pelophilus]MBT0664886.1 hypothetical protein [Geoanaerobacter pelophilus]